MGLNLKHVPYIPLLIDFDKNQFLREVKQIPMYNYRTWHSCTIYGLSPEKNLSNKNYGFDESEPKKWFFEKQCPTIVNWLKTQKYFIPNRVRVWKVAPNEYGEPHTDASSPHDKNLIIPIYTPQGFESHILGCKVPMNNPVIYNNYLEHSFKNSSNEDRWSLIVRVKHWITQTNNQVEISKKTVRKIQWETFVKFLFSRSHITLSKVQRMKEYCDSLGKLKSKNVSPEYNHFGLFKDNTLIGVTSIQEFSDFNYLPKNAKRYRYLYIDEEYRGNDLSYKMLNYLVPSGPLFGYAKNNHIGWCLKHGFNPITDVDETGHQFMLRE